MVCADKGRKGGRRIWYAASERGWPVNIIPNKSLHAAAETLGGWAGKEGL